MCYSIEIYGMTYEFYGFEGVEAYLPPAPGGKIAALNPALDSWFRYFQVLAAAGGVKKVLVVNPYDESAEKIVRNNKNAIWMLNKIIEQRSSNPILGQQANNIILMDYEKVIEKAEEMGSEVFFSILLHESTHLLEQYLTDDCGIYNRLDTNEKKGYCDAYRDAVLISEKKGTEFSGTEFSYLNETARYQQSDRNIEGEALTCLVEVLTYYHCKEPNSSIVYELQEKLDKAIEIARNGGVLPPL